MRRCPCHFPGYGSPFCEPFKLGTREWTEQQRNGSVGRRIQSGGRLRWVTLASTVLLGIGPLRDKSMLRPQAISMAPCACVRVCVCLTTGTRLVSLYMCALWMKVWQSCLCAGVCTHIHIYFSLKLYVFPVHLHICQLFQGLGAYLCVYVYVFLFSWVLL